MKASQKRQRWEEEILKPSLERFPERKEEFTTSSGILLNRVYSPEDLDIDYLTDIGFPGEYPFTRGVQATMYRGRLWTMRQYAGYATAQETNARFRYLLGQGQTGLSVAFDLPTQIGYDADNSISAGEVGKVGVSISSLEDMEILFNEISLNKVSTSMTINAPAAILLAMYIALAKKQNVELKDLRGTIQNDIIKEYVARGTYIFPPEPSMRLITDVFRFCERETPRWNTISISGYHIREAGSTAVQEVAFTLSNGIAYVQAAIDSGLDVDSFAKKLSFFFSAHNNFLEEIAKFRAARRLWARIMKERFAAQEEGSCKLRFHTQTAGSTLTVQQSYNNVVRVTLQALAAVLGGTQSLHTNSMDEALWLPTEEAVQVALRTQQIIAYESGVGNTIDPATGSFLIEKLTNEIEERALDYIQRIDEMGGALAAVEAGFMQAEIQKSAYQHQRQVESNQEIVVGVNAYCMDEDIKPKKLKVDPAVEAEQRRRLEQYRQKRDESKVQELSSSLENAARGNDNLVPVFITCVENQLTLGEICTVLRDVWGEHKPPAWI
jgi:methylmalonyl-CoA mutase N-terminal domain/subunit